MTSRNHLVKQDLVPKKHNKDLIERKVRKIEQKTRTLSETNKNDKTRNRIPSQYKGLHQIKIKLAFPLSSKHQTGPTTIFQRPKTIAIKLLQRKNKTTKSLESIRCQIKISNNFPGTFN